MKRELFAIGKHGHVDGTSFLFSPHGASLQVGRPGVARIWQGWPKFDHLPYSSN